MITAKEAVKIASEEQERYYHDFLKTLHSLIRRAANHGDCSVEVTRPKYRASDIQAHLVSKGFQAFYTCENLCIRW